MKILPRSLFGRLVVVQVSVAAVLASLLPLLISHLLISTTNAFVGHELDRSANLVRSRIAYGQHGWVFTSPVPRMFDAKAGIRNVRVIDDSGRTWLDQGPVYAIPASRVLLASAGVHRLWRGIDVASYPIEESGHRGWMVISSDRRRPESLVANVTTAFLHRFLWIVPALILCTLALTLLFFAHAIRAVRDASRRADAIGAKALDVRLEVGALPLEVQPLARAMNEALDRVEQSYSEQAEFAGNVAHELRNPLATIGCRIEEITDPVLRQRMSSSLGHAAHVVDQLMMLARLGGEEAALRPIDLRSIALEAIEGSAPRIIANGRTIQFDDRVPGLATLVDGDEGLARLSLDNLIDNAQRHTPLGTHIRVGLGPGSRLSVEDDGPGIPAADRDRIHLRHWRGTNRRDGAAGLGLSIVTKAMQAQKGSLEIGVSATGAELALIFDRAPSAGPRSNDPANNSASLPRVRTY